MTPEFIILGEEAGKKDGNVSSLLLAALGTTDDRKENSFREWKRVGISQEFRTEQAEPQAAS